MDAAKQRIEEIKLLCEEVLLQMKAGNMVKASNRVIDIERCAHHLFSLTYELAFPKEPIGVPE